ncbi:DUF2510 domain-containing protein [Brachybacterium hainanense]|uniref:DUF2510 domain-containing protein n=1 Tax=Brachybacterium hainanense TaxID=1541174 RepID=A0ABV6RBQ9_9MICO
MNDQGGPPPGWYKNPADDGGELRWWDGSSWTEHLQPVATNLQGGDKPAPEQSSFLKDLTSGFRPKGEIPTVVVKTQQPASMTDWCCGVPCAVIAVVAIIAAVIGGIQSLLGIG